MISNQLEVFPATVDLDADLQNDLNLDDLEMTLLMLAVEDEFGFSVLVEEEKYLKTGQDIVEYIQRKLQGKPEASR